MSLRRSDSAESTCTVLTCTSEGFQDLYNNDRLRTEVLSDDALCNIIRPNSARLRAADPRCRLDDLLSAMLKHAPHLLGQRYVAVYLHVAHQKGEDGVVNAAKAWLDYLLLPSSFVRLSIYLHLLTPDGSVLATSKAMKTEPSSSQTPAIGTTMQHIESASREDQRVLRANVSIMPLSSRFNLLI